MKKKILFFVGLYMISCPIYSQKFINYSLPIVQALYVEGNSLWIGTSNGLFKMDISTGQFISSYTMNDGLAGNDVISIAIDKQKNKWFGTNNSGVSKFDGVNWKTFTTRNGLPSNTVMSIAVDQQNNKWFGTYAGGVSKFDDVNWNTFTSANGIASDTVGDLAIDLKGNKWFGSNYNPGHGITKFDNTNWIRYNKTNGLIANDIICITIDSQNNKWFGSFTGGVSKFDDNNWTNYTKIDGLASNSVTAISIDSKNNKWFGTYGEGVSKFDGSNWITYNKSNNELADNFVISMVVDGQGNLWVGTLKGLSKLNGIFTSLDKENLLNAVNLQFYPNPVKDVCKIQYNLPKRSSISIRIYNQMGQEVKTIVKEMQDIGNYREDIPLLFLENGIYFLSLMTDYSYQSVKIIKQ